MDLLICPLCGSEAYLCDTPHTDGPGARIHCRSASLHNFTVCSFDGCTAIAETRHMPCCSSHDRPLCCEHYCFTHFVQVNPCTPETHRKAS